MKVTCTSFVIPSDSSSNLLPHLPLQQFSRGLLRSNNIHVQWASENPERLHVIWSSSLKRSRDIETRTKLRLTIVNPLLGWSESHLQSALLGFFRLSVLLNDFHKVRIMQEVKGHWLWTRYRNYWSKKTQKKQHCCFREETKILKYVPKFTKPLTKRSILEQNCSCFSLLH